MDLQEAIDDPDGIPIPQVLFAILSKALEVILLSYLIQLDQRSRTQDGWKEHDSARLANDLFTPLAKIRKTLAELERRGFIVRRGERIQIAYDVIVRAIEKKGVKLP